MSVKKQAVEEKTARSRLIETAVDQTMADEVFICDLEGNIIYANDRACKALGYNQEELMTMSVLEINPTVTKQELIKNNKWARKKGIQILESTHARKDGSTYPVEISYRIDTIEGREISFSTVRDITERRKAERELEQLRFALQNASDAVYLTDSEGRIHYSNDSACRLLGYTKNELLSLNIFDIDIGFDTPVKSEEHRKLMECDEGIFETRHKKKGGSAIPVEISFSNAVFDGVRFSFSFARDISDRKEAERVNKELTFAIENAVDGIYLFDETGRITHTNKTACNMLGYTYEELTGMTILDLTPEYPRNEWPGHINQIRKGGLAPFEVNHKKKDGGRIPVEITVNNKILDDVEYFCAFARDIRRRKETEKRNDELSFAIENAIDAIYLNDEEGNIYYANKSACESLGYTFDELTCMNVADFDENFSTEILKMLRRDRTGELPAPPPETCHIRKDGTRFPVEVNFNSRVINGVHYYCSFVRDITERKETQEENEKLRGAIDNAMDAVYIFDSDGNIQYANQSAARELGYETSELESMNIKDIDPSITGTPGRESLRKQRWEESLRGEQIIFETYHKRKDGIVFPVECSHSSMDIQGDQEIGISFVRNVTERKKNLRKTQELQFAIDNAIDAVFLIDKDARFYYVNNSACRILGYSRQELTNMCVFDIDPIFSREQFRELWSNESRASIDTFESVAKRRNGEEIPIEVNFRVTEFEDNEYACAILRDITERKEAVRHMEEFRFAIDNANDPVYLYDSEANIIYGNKIACDTLGYSKDEITTLKVWDLDPRMTPEAWKDIYPKVERGELKSFESINKAKDGTEFPVEITATNVTYDDYKFGCSFNHDITERKQEEQRLLFLQFAIDSAGDAIFITTNDGSILYANQSACASLDYTEEELRNMHISDINPELDKLRKDINLWQNSSSNPHTVESVHKRKDGTVFPIEIQSRVINFDGNTFNCSVARDITERKKAQASLQESEERFRIIAETSPVALLISRIRDGLILYANKQAGALFGKHLSDITGHNISRIFNTTDNEKELADIIQSKEHVYSHEIMLRREDSSEIWLSLSARTITLHGEKVLCSALLDITESHKLAEQLSYQASYDSLTDLVNRREFQSHLQRVITSARQIHSENALCFLDLDQFKVINDTCGHIAGDELLRQLGKLLQNNIRKRDILARLGGDEFAILLENCNLQQAGRVANTIRQSIQDFRFHWEEHTFNIGVSIGLVSIDSQSGTVIDVLRRADTACYTAKDMGRNRIHIYHSDDEELSKRHGEMQWMSRINEALEENRFQLWSQEIAPISSIEDSGQHFELLLRLQDKDGNIISPAAFLPTAERYNIAPRIDHWVVTTVFNWYSRHPEKFRELHMCSINLSGQSLSSEEFLNYIIDCFDNINLQPHKFCFEVTETAAIANLSYATHFIKTLKEYGCHFALDDFGSGLSSFAYLKNLPVDFIKIDGQFVKDILDDPIDLAMVKSINDIGHVMGKTTIAEFVENTALLEKLREVGVDYAQGYAIAKPSPLITGTEILGLHK